MKHSTLILGLILLFIGCTQGDGADHGQNSSESITKSPNQIEVLTLGTFHFDFPNRDVSKVAKEDQIDVLAPKYQKEIENIVDKLAKFKPTRIAIEIDPSRQNQYDSIYNAYLNGKYSLEKDEAQQIGFRLAKKLNLKRLDCVNDWEYHYEGVMEHIKDTVARKQFLDYFYNHPDMHLETPRAAANVFKEQGILAELKRKNSKEFLTADLGDYLIGIFKYETPENKNFGVDFVTGWWFNRNLKIIRNIQRLDTTEEDRILVIYGSGHMNILNTLFEASPEYKLLNVHDYL